MNVDNNSEKRSFSLRAENILWETNFFEMKGNKINLTAN